MNKKSQEHTVRVYIYIGRARRLIFPPDYGAPSPCPDSEVTYCETEFETLGTAKIVYNIQTNTFSTCRFSSESTTILSICVCVCVCVCVQWTMPATNMWNSRVERTDEQFQQEKENVLVNMSQLRASQLQEARAEQNQQRQLERRQVRRFLIETHTANDRQHQHGAYTSASFLRLAFEN